MQASGSIFILFLLPFKVRPDLTMVLSFNDDFPFTQIESRVSIKLEQDAKIIL